MSEETETLKSTLSKLNITLKPACYKMDVRPLLKVVLEAFFGPARALVDMITEKIPSPAEAAASLVCQLRYSTVLCDSQFFLRYQGHTLVP
jgi:U5 small nuclear ribonucleoprotein component